mgnify:CR=1 FL=1
MNLIRSNQTTSSGQILTEVWFVCLFCLHAMTTQTSSHSIQIHYSGRGRRRKGATTIAARVHVYIHVFMRASSIILNNILLPFLSWYQTPQDQSIE